MIREANRAGIVLRTGCFCNPGAGESALAFPGDRLRTVFGDPRRGQSVDDLVTGLDRPTLGVVRVSYGAVSDVSDAARVIRFLEGLCDHPTTTRSLPPRTGC